MTTHRNAERIQALIANDTTPWAAADQAYLEGLTDDRLAAFEAAATKPAETPAAASGAAPAAVPAPVAASAAADPAAAPAATKTTAQWLAEAPRELRDMVSRQQRADAARRTELIAAVSAATREYTDAELKAMSIDELERTARVAGAASGAVDYTALRSVPETVAEPPRPYDIAIARRNKSATA